MDGIYGWTGKFLRIDLTSGQVRTESTLPYAASYIGGRGIATRLAWEELSGEVGAFDAENPLMFFTGPLTGSSAPFAGRTTVCAVSPQAYPVEWFTRSSFGGLWGTRLKYAGYDGLVITGKAERPSYLWINDDEVELRDASSLWGLGTYATQKSLEEELGGSISVISIGQAGENLCRFAVINSDTESAAGQGGFGAVMGAKNLKAIAVRGTGAVRAADPEEFARRSLAIAREASYSAGWFFTPRLDPAMAARYGERFIGCSQACSARCSRRYVRVPSVLKEGTFNSGQFFCVAEGLISSEDKWDIGFEAGFDMSNLCNDYGLNHWELVRGIVPWLVNCRNAGYLAEFNGEPLDFDNPHFWARFLKAVACREEMGDTIAEGGMRAADILGFGQDLLIQHYIAWGHARHWDGHGVKGNRITFPFWLVVALQWAFDTRDPMGSGHGYTTNIWGWSPLAEREYAIPWEELKGVAKQVYGSEHIADPLSGYRDKAIPAIWHGDRSALKDTLPICDNAFPRLVSRASEDRIPRADGMEGPSFEYHLFTTLTGLDISEEEFDHIGERIFNLDRALMLRNYGRSRRDDETVIPYFEQPDFYINRLIGENVRTDPVEFRRLMDDYYRRRGWDAETGNPTEEKLRELDLADVAEELARGGLLPT